MELYPAKLALASEKDMAMIINNVIWYQFEVASDWGIVRKQ